QCCRWQQGGGHGRRDRRGGLMADEPALRGEGQARLRAGRRDDRSAGRRERRSVRPSAAALHDRRARGAGGDLRARELSQPVQPDLPRGGERRLLRAAPAGPAMTSRPKNADWLALTVERALEPDLPICDPHHHLWDQNTARIAPRYLLDEILEDVGAGHNILSTVFIECGAMFKSDGPEALRPVGETEFVNGIAAMSASGRYG